jgi:CRP-like cAMP-binding protein
MAIDPVDRRDEVARNADQIHRILLAELIIQLPAKYLSDMLDEYPGHGIILARQTEMMRQKLQRLIFQRDYLINKIAEIDREEKNESDAREQSLKSK